MGGDHTVNRVNSSTNNVRCVRFTYHALYRRTVAEIQQEVAKKSERNVASRVFHARNDKDTIAGWNVDLNRILHIFNVRLVVCTWLSLIVPFQTELAINTHMMVLDLHRNVLTGTSSHHPSVGTISHLSTIERSPPARLKPSLRSRIRWVHGLLGSRPLSPRGPVSDVTS